MNNVEKRARRLFERQPHGHPSGEIPDWEIQPNHIKAVFRGYAMRGEVPPAQRVDHEDGKP